MTWQELYPIVKTQAEFAVLRYEELSRRKDKIQELIAQCWEKYQRDVTTGKEVRRQDYKCFVTQRAKQVDTRSVCKKGYGGTSTIDVLSFNRRRPEAQHQLLQLSECHIPPTAKPVKRIDRLCMRIATNAPLRY